MVLIMGHRGAAGLEPENTLRSYRKGMALGVDYVECDVRLTRDGHIVLIHDRTVDRTTNGSGDVNSFSFDEIRQLDAGQGEKIPTLTELLDLAKDRVVELYIEIKDAAAIGLVFELLREKGMAERVFLTSGDTDILRAIRAQDSQIRIGHIFGDPPADAVSRAVEVHAQRVSCRYTNLTQEFVQQIHDHSIEITAWPPNTLEEMQQALSYGVDVICTDRPDVALQLRK